MAQFTLMLNLQLTLLIFMLTGMFSYRLKIITDQNISGMRQLLIKILLPVMVFNSFRSVTMDVIRLSVQALILTTILYAVVYFIGKWIYRAFPNEQAKVLHYGTLVNTVGFTGLPLVNQVFGDVGSVIASVYLIPHRIYTWTLGLFILADQQTESTRTIIKRLATNPSIIAVFLGLARGLLKLQLPAFLDKSITMMSTTVTPFAMIVIGASIATVPWSKLIDFPVILYCLVRLLGIPFAVMGVLTLFHFDHTLIGVMTLMAAMPAGVLVSVLASEYHLDEQFAARLTLVSILASIFTTPIVMAFV
ncbi:MAG: AEC family transporter [Aerococcus sp.]|nr:AEC family transporter [Aerococcus sp.]